MKAPLVPTFSRSSLLEELGCSSGSEGESERPEISSKIAKKRRFERVSSSEVNTMTSGLKESGTTGESASKSAKKQKLATSVDKASKVSESAKKAKDTSVPVKWHVPSPSSSDDEVSRKSKESGKVTKSKKEKKSKQ